MYVLLHGAKKNLGDFLIGSRCRALLEMHQPDQELVELSSWEPLEPHLELLDRADAVVILGGPGYQPKLYPKVYPLTQDLQAIRPPIVPMGLGWKGFPGDDLTLSSYRFSRQSMAALRKMSKGSPWLGCRDHLSVEALRRNGIENGLMTGCPVWYHLPSIGKAAVLPDQVNKLVFTPAQLPLYGQQSIDVAGVITALFPEAERIASFHRGIGGTDRFTPSGDSDNNLRLARELEALGFQVVDVSGDLSKIDFYSDCDLHVGYRVHAHIHFLSHRRPSLLLHEDGRGRGVSGALELAGVDAFERTRAGVALAKVRPRLIARRVGKLVEELRACPRAPGKVRELLQGDLDNGFERYRAIPGRIDATYEVMKTFLASLP